VITDLIIRVINVFSHWYFCLLVWWAPIGDWFYYLFHPQKETNDDD